MRRSPPVVCIYFGVAALVASATGALTGSPPVLAQVAVREAPFGDKAGSLAVNYTRLTPHIATAGLLVNGGQDPRKDGGAKFFGMTFADGLAAPCRRPLGGNQRPGGKRCQRRKPPEAGAEGPR